MPLFQIGLQPPLKVYGVGSFTYDSYLIFWYISPLFSFKGILLVRSEAEQA
jgi:hypothetical protein